MPPHLRALLVLVASVVVPFTAMAQASVASSHHEVNLAITYSTQRDRLTNGTNFWRQGGSVEFFAQMAGGLGAAVNVSGSHVSNINGTGVNLTTLSTTFGPRYTWSSSSGRVALFGQGLIGESYGLDGVFPSPQGAQTNYDAFALQVGGGVDLRVKPHLALRPLQAEWIRTQFPNGAANVQNDLRLSAGVVLRLKR